jgi:hypothetical protein
MGRTEGTRMLRDLERMELKETGFHWEARLPSGKGEGAIRCLRSYERIYDEM